MNDSFLNWNIIKEKNNIICEMNENKTEIKMNIENCDQSINKKIVKNLRGLLAMYNGESYKYVANMIQIFDIYGGIEDRNLLKREYKIKRINKIKYYIVKRNNNVKLKELAKIQKCIE